MALALDTNDTIDYLFAGARAGGFDVAPLAGRYDLDQALALQLGVLERWREAGEERGGWKVGFTSGRARDLLGAGVRPFGYVLRSRIFASAARVRLARIARPSLEPELCLVARERLAGSDLTAAQARAAVACVAAGFEINEARLRGAMDPAALLADDLTQWGIVVGDRASPDALSPELRVRLSCDGVAKAEAGPDYEIDDPFLSLARLAATLHRFGLAIEPGDHVITGAWARCAIEAPGRWTAEFTGIGSVSVEFT